MQVVVEQVEEEEDSNTALLRKNTNSENNLKDGNRSTANLGLH